MQSIFTGRGSGGRIRTDASSRPEACPTLPRSVERIAPSFDDARDDVLWVGSENVTYEPGHVYHRRVSKDSEFVVIKKEKPHACSFGLSAVEVGTLRSFNCSHRVHRGGYLDVHLSKRQHFFDRESRRNLLKPKGVIDPSEQADVSHDQVDAAPASSRGSCNSRRVSVCSNDSSAPS